METTPEVQDALEEARREGHARGLSLGLFWVAAATAAFGAFRGPYEAPKFREVFAHTKIALPGLSVLVLEYGGLVGAALVAATVGCGVLTFRSRNSRLTVRTNGLLLAATLTWGMIVTVALQAPLLSLLRGVGGGR